MKFKIHRGTKEIGGSCVEIWTDNTRIVMDFGMPLVDENNLPFNSNQTKDLNTTELINQGILPNIPDLFNSENNISLIISHAHQDHYGLIDFINNEIPVHLGKASHKLIDLTNVFTNKKCVIYNPHYFESGKTFKIGDFSITPFLMDHSAFDSYAFQINANGKSLFYSGDFRIHGRKAKAFDWFSKNVKSNIDYLLLEGTTISRTSENFPTETKIESKLVETFKNVKGINLIYASGQNIDRLVSIYRACKRTNKILAIDFYIANVLTELAKLGTSLPFPSDKFPDIKVFFPYRLSKMISNQGNEKLLYRFKNYKITKEEIDSEFEKIVMLVRPSMQSDLEYLKNLGNGMFIYSMWNGYRKEKSTADFITTLTNKGMLEKEIHTSGHADTEGLKRMVDVLKPKNLIPIHTFESDKYAKIFQDTKVIVLKDKEIIEI